jgi:hypothetical protein
MRVHCAAPPMVLPHPSHSPALPSQNPTDKRYRSARNALEPSGRRWLRGRGERSHATKDAECVYGLFNSSSTFIEKSHPKRQHVPVLPPVASKHPSFSLSVAVLQRRLRNAGEKR